MNYYSIIIESDKELFDKVINHLKSIGYTFQSDKISPERALTGALAIIEYSKTLHFDDVEQYKRDDYNGTIITFEKFCAIFDYPSSN